MIRILPKQFQVQTSNKEEVDYLYEMQKKLNGEHYIACMPSPGYFYYLGDIIFQSNHINKVDYPLVLFTEFKEHFSNVDNFQWLVGQTFTLDAVVEYGCRHWKDEHFNKSSKWKNQHVHAIEFYGNTLCAKVDRKNYKGSIFCYIPITELYRTGLIYELELPEEEPLKVTDLGKKEAIWCQTEEECEKIHELMHEAGLKWCSGQTYKDVYTRCYGTAQCYYPYDGEHCNKGFYEERDYKIYPASLFIKQTNMQQQDIIGYKLKEEYQKYSLAASTICNRNQIFIQSGELMKANDKADCEAIQALEKAGVLDLWFEPVYKPREPKYNIGEYVTVVKEVCEYQVGDVFKIEDVWDKPSSSKDGYVVSKYKDRCGIRTSYIRKATAGEIETATTHVISMNGQFDLTVKNKKVYYKTSDITQYVKSMVLSFEAMNKQYQGYDALIDLDSLQFRKTGCEVKTTRFSDWKKVYDMIKD